MNESTKLTSQKFNKKQQKLLMTLGNKIMAGAVKLQWGSYSQLNGQLVSLVLMEYPTIPLMKSLKVVGQTREVAFGKLFVDGSSQTSNQL